MSDIFEKLQKIAREEFGCELARVQEKSSFKELFGISHQEIEMLSKCEELIGYWSEKNNE